MSLRSITREQLTLLISFLIEGGILGEEGCFFCAGCIFWRFVGGGV
jgi:hypothetical protein